ncbi:MAG: hypothetical protein JNK70_14375, partial [Phycisphaerae bacterium]|nr:hypothetical protein [Phycisphaerae bacterium]
MEKLAAIKAIRTMERTQVVVLVIDAAMGVTDQDQRIARMAHERGKGVVVALNKWDLVEGRANDQGKPITPADYEDYLRKELKGLAFAPISLVSAHHALNLKPTIDLAFALLDQSRSRASTGKLNRLIEGILETSNPPSKLGTRAKVYYVAQVAAEPPTIVLVVNRPELFTPNYLRFLENRLREALPFAEVPMR